MPAPDLYSPKLRYLSTRLAGTGTPGSRVSGAALSAVFNSAVGCAITPDGTTMYVLESSLLSPFQGPGYGTIRQIANLNGTGTGNPTVGGIWGTIPGTSGPISGAIKVGPVTGRVYVTNQVAPNSTGGDVSTSPGNGNIGYFNPDGSWGGYILNTSVPVLMGFDFSPDEQSFFYSWTDSSNSGSWWALALGKMIVGGTQDNSFLDTHSLGYGGFFGGPSGTAFKGSAGLFLDTDGYLWWLEGGDFTSNTRRVLAYPTVDYSQSTSDWFPDKFNQRVRQNTAGLCGASFFPGSKYIVAIGNAGSSDVYLQVCDIAKNQGRFVEGPLDEAINGSFPDWGEVSLGGYPTSWGRHAYYPTRGAIYQLDLLTGLAPLRQRQRGDSLAGATNGPRFGGGRMISTSRSQQNSIRQGNRGTFT